MGQFRHPSSLGLGTQPRSKAELSRVLGHHPFHFTKKSISLLMVHSNKCHAISNKCLTSSNKKLYSSNKCLPLLPLPLPQSLWGLVADNGSPSRRDPVERVRWAPLALRCPCVARGADPRASGTAPGAAQTKPRGEGDRTRKVGGCWGKTGEMKAEGWWRNQQTSQTGRRSARCQQSVRRLQETKSLQWFENYFQVSSS